MCVGRCNARKWLYRGWPACILNTFYIQFMINGMSILLQYVAEVIIDAPYSITDALLDQYKVYT